MIARRAVALDAERAPLRQVPSTGSTNVPHRRRGTWPAALAELGPPPVADVALIAHVGYDIEAIGPFIDAMEQAAGRLCVAVLTDRSPASVADPVLAAGPRHGARPAAGPARPRRAPPGARPSIRGSSGSSARRGRSTPIEGLATFVRRQLWIDEDGEKERPLPDALAAMARERDDDGWTLAAAPVGSIGILTWEPGPEAD